MEAIKYTSDYFKNEVIGWMLYHRGFLGAVTESYNGSDVLGVRETLYTVEVEVKVERGDLRYELKIIEEIKNHLEPYSPRDYMFKENKQCKHMRNLRPLGQHTAFQPNEFYFLVPEELVELTEEFLEDTPYGIMAFKEIHYHWFTRIEIIKRAKKIHKVKIDQEHLLGLVRKTSVENCVTREKLINAKEQLKARKETTELIFPEWFDSKYFIKTACIDNQLVEEIKNLWDNGVQTTACCAGHGDLGFISVKPEHIHKMEKLGYEHFCDPGFDPARTHFKPKTKEEK